MPPERDHVLAVDRGDLADGPPPVAAPRHVDDGVDRSADVPADRRRRELAATGEEQLESRERVGGRSGVERRQCAIVPGGERLEERGGLARRADLADDDPVGPHPERVRDEVSLPDSRAVASRHALEVDDVRMREHELVGVLDDHEPLVRRDRRRERAEERALAGAGRAAHEEIRPCGDRAREERRRGGRQASARDPRRRRAVERERERAELPDRERRTADRPDDRVRPAAIPHARVDEGLLDRELAADARRDAVRELGEGRRVPERHRRAFEAAGTLDEDLGRAVHEHVGHRRIVEERLERTEAEELGAQLVRRRVGERSAGGAADPLAEERPPPGIGVEHEQRARIEAARDLGSDARDELRSIHRRARMSPSTARSVGARAANVSAARNGSRGIAPRSGHGRRAPMAAASSGAAPTTTRPTAQGASRSRDTAQNAAWSWATLVPVTTRR